MMDRNTKNKALTIKIVWQPESAEIVLIIILLHADCED